VNLHNQAGQQEAEMSGQGGGPSACKFETGELVIKVDETIQSDVSMIDSAVEKIVSLVKQSGCCHDTQDVDLALREALANAIIHGNRSNHEKFVRVCLAVQRDCTILIIVKDTGPGFEPIQLPNPLSRENLLAEHGRGIFLVNQLMDDVRFTFDGGTSIHMRRNSPAENSQ
jgi:serine/threonine-protein kinase RsbW